MFRTMLGGKVHRATVTQADLHYVGSITIDQDLMRAADILEGEQVDVVDITNGARLTTYAITGKAGSGVIGINGAAAHLINPGDLVIIMSFRTVEERSVGDHVPRVVHVDERNSIVALGSDPSEPVPGAINQMAGA
jgi:aspartate 1-decarboxylase